MWISLGVIFQPTTPRSPSSKAVDKSLIEGPDAMGFPKEVQTEEKEQPVFRAWRTEYDPRKPWLNGG